MENIIDVIIVDDHQLFRKGLALQLKEFKNIRVIAEAPDGQAFLDLLKTTKADLVFMDLKMPVMDGVEATRQAVIAHPEIKIVALSMYGEDEYLESMLQAGAKGFLLKNINKSDLEKAIKSVMGGNSYFSDELLSILTQKFVNPPKKKEEPVKLSDREIEVLGFIVKGHTNVEIAEALFLSQRTVDGHRANLISKVGAKNTVGLVTYAIKNKLVSLD